MQRSLTPRSSRAPTAGHQARSGGTRCIFASPGLASHRRCRLNSNVRLRKNRMLCRYRCLRPPLVQAKTRAPAELKPVFRTCPPSSMLMNTLSASAALTSFGLRGTTCGRLLFEFKAMVVASRFQVSHAHWLRNVGAQGRCNTVRATLAHRTSSGVHYKRQSASRKSASWLLVAGHRRSTVRRAEPNPSLKLSPNGGPPGPVWRYAVHFRQPGPGVLPRRAA